MEKQFEREIMLIGEKAFSKLANSSVAVFGLGGVGSAACEALARAGVGSLIIIDKDIVDITNLNRQLIALHSTIGQPKTALIKSRCLDINPSINITEYNMFFNSDTAHLIDFENVDYIIDAIDTVTSKLLLISIAKEKNIPIISSMGTGNKTDPGRFEITDIEKTSVCPLCKVMRRELKKRNIKNVDVIYSKEEPKKAQPFLSNPHLPSSISFVPPVAGMRLAGYVINKLIGKD